MIKLTIGRSGVALSARLIMSATLMTSSASDISKRTVRDRLVSTVYRRPRSSLFSAAANWVQIYDAHHQLCGSQGVQATGRRASKEQCQRKEMI